MAVAKQISSELCGMTSLPAAINRFGLLRFASAFLLSIILTVLNSGLAVKARQELSEGSNCAHIVIKKGCKMGPPCLSNTKLTALPEIARLCLYKYFGKLNESGASNKEIVKAGADLSFVEWADKFRVEPEFLKSAGVFVTLSKHGKTRACWGSVNSREANIVRETVLSTLGALKKEYRFKPIQYHEVKDLKFQVTVVKGLQAVTHAKEINPFKDGVMVRSGGRGAVILPGEAVDSHYQVVLAKLKAGITPEQACQIYKIRTEIYD